MNVGGAYGGGKAGASFDPITFVQRPQVVLRAVCWVSFSKALPFDFRSVEKSNMPNLFENHDGEVNMYTLPPLCHLLPAIFACSQCEQTFFQSSIFRSHT